MPRGLRRTDPAGSVFDFRSGLPMRSSLALPLATPEPPSIEVVLGLPHGSSNAGAQAQHLGPALDVAQGMTTGRTGQARTTIGTPFKITER